MKRVIAAAAIGVITYAAASASGGGAWVADTWGSRMVKVSPTGSIIRTVGPFTYPYGVALDPGERTVWFTVNADTVIKMTDLGEELFRRSYGTEQISVNPGDGACWIRVSTPRAVARLDRNGSETANVPLGRPSWVSSAAADGSAWVTDGPAGVVLRLSASGSIISSFGGFDAPGACAAHASDNSVSLVEAANVVRVATSGSIIFRTPLAGGFCVAANASDDATWVGAGSNLYKLNAAGSLVNTIPAGGMVNCVTVNSADGSAWVAIYDLNAIAKYTASGSRVFLLGGFTKVKGMAAEQIPAYEELAPASMGKVKALFR